MKITRRRFLRNSAITAVGLSFSSPLLDLPAFAAGRRAASSRRAASRLASGDKVVVALNLFGGNDGLNALVPISQYDRYTELRPRIAIPRERLLTLQNAPDLALNPAMSGLHALYGEGKVAVLPGVGAPHDAYGLFDHEASQYLFQTGDVTGSATVEVPSGWVGRWLDSVDEGEVAPGINFGGGGLVPNMLTGNIDHGIQAQRAFEVTMQLHLGESSIRVERSRDAFYSRHTSKGA